MGRSKLPVLRSGIKSSPVSFFLKKKKKFEKNYMKINFFLF
jgi:hypothetical protein